MTIEIAATTHDLFISYAEADCVSVDGFLIDALDQAGVNYYSEDAFALGVPRLVEFERAIKQSRRTLLILSPAYLADTFGQFVDVLVNSYGMETATWPVIPLSLTQVELPPRLSQLVRLDASDAEAQQRALVRLCAELHRPVPGAAAEEPREPRHVQQQGGGRHDQEPREPDQRGGIQVPAELLDDRDGPVAGRRADAAARLLRLERRGRLGGGRQPARRLRRGAGALQAVPAARPAGGQRAPGRRPVPGLLQAPAAGTAEVPLSRRVALARRACPGGLSPGRVVTGTRPSLEPSR